MAIGQDQDEPAAHTTTPNVLGSKPLLKPKFGGGSGFGKPMIGGSSSASKPSFGGNMKPAFMLKKKEFKMKTNDE